MRYSLHAFVLLLCCSFILLSTGCGGGSEVPEGEVLVSFKEKVLTKDQLGFYIPDGLDERDSARYAQQFINQWIREQAVMDMALSEDETLADRIEYKVEDYRAKLIMHEYETKLVENSMQKDIPDSSVINFYHANRDYFRSKEDLFSYFYLVTTSDKLSKVDSWMRSNTKDDLAKLQQWAATNTLEAKLDSAYDGETRINQLSKGYYGSLKKVGKGQLIQWTGVIQGERRRYRFKLLSTVKAGDFLPVSLCEEKIKGLLLNERRVKLIEETENKIVKDAEAKNYVIR